MNLLRFSILLQFTSALAMGQLAPQSKSADVPNQPVVLVQSLYTQVVARHPLGIPDGANEKIFMPYLSKALHHRIDLFIACNADFFRQHPQPDLKGPSGIWEDDIFSGGEDQAEPRSFHIEKTQSEKDGSIRVFVRLTWGPHERPWIWRVAAVLTQEDDHYVVDDVIYLKDSEHRGPEAVDSRLSEHLSEGCDGPRWVGKATSRK